MEDSKKQQPKTFLERFNDIEQATVEVVKLSMDLAQRTHQTSSVLNEVMQSQRLLAEGLNTLMDMMNEQKTLKTANDAELKTEIENRITQKRLNDRKAEIAALKEKGILVDAESIQDLSSDMVVCYSMEPEIVYGYEKLSSFNEDIKPQLVGKKVGDSVESLKILELYSVVANNETASNNTEGGNNEQKENSGQTA